MQPDRVGAELQKAIGISADDPGHQVGRDWFTISARGCGRAVETFVASLPIQIGPQLVGLAGKQFIAGAGIALNRGEPDHSAFSAAGYPVDSPDHLQCGLGRIVAAGELFRKSNSDAILLGGDYVSDQLARMVSQPSLCRMVARIPAYHDLKPARITKRRHLLDRGDTATVEGLPDCLFQRPECGLVKVHGRDCAVYVAALEALHYAPQDDARTDVVDRLNERGETSCSKRSRGDRRFNMRVRGVQCQTKRSVLLRTGI
ncbi:hypothetical protein [Mesorhizobium sp.]|uniref:hypothetical protein n=1 Tax=Mesorhizobium sp. TaxID=1871066 RepID=UPI00257F0A8D|nr:hypothetical protein [Mesorhizobium sp.]